MIYEIAGLRVQLKNRSNYTDYFCRDYLSSDQTSPCDMEAEVTKDEFLEERSKTTDPDYYVENVCLYRTICRKMLSFNRFLLHAAVLEFDRNAYAFLGKSGAGKSTHTSLWLDHVQGAEILNGDKPIVEKADDGFYAYGTPWMGKEGRGKKGRAELKAFCFIEKAKENKIERLSVSEFTTRLFTQLLLTASEEEMSALLAFADELVKKVPAYVLYCDISEDAVRTSFEILTGKKYGEVRK